MNLRIFLAGTALALAVSATGAVAEDRETVLRAIDSCAALADGPSRLACYDRLAPRVKDALARPPQALAGSRPPTEQEQKSWFGFDMGDLFGTSTAQQTTPQQFGIEKTERKQQEVEAAQIDSIAAGVTDYAKTPFGKFIVFLDNGQVWRELPSEASNVLFKRNAKDNTVEIERGMFGSYILHVNGSMRGYKVERVK